MDEILDITEADSEGFLPILDKPRVRTKRLDLAWVGQT